jgi:hypothetical protein
MPDIFELDRSRAASSYMIAHRVWIPESNLFLTALLAALEDKKASMTCLGALDEVKQATLDAITVGKVLQNLVPEDSRLIRASPPCLEATFKSSKGWTHQLKMFMSCS